MLYITFGNQSNGVFASYVTEVCKFLKSEFRADIKVVSFISIRGFWSVRKARKLMYPNSVILPMFPRIGSWKLNILTLILVWPFIGKKNVIALSPIAANLALMLKSIKLIRKIVYDGEGATAAEWNEYDVINNEKLKNEIYTLEGNAVNKSDFRRTVSFKMINYWNTTFNYKGFAHVVIPCTINNLFVKHISDQQAIEARKIKEGYRENDIILVFSGSSSQWQSLELVDTFLLSLFNKYPNIKFLMLIDKAPSHLEIFKKYSDRISVKWVEYSRVAELLEICDYGILIRESAVTNKVAAPTKFAEYLACGLKVLISPEIGDYSEFVKLNDCGFVVEKEGEINGMLGKVDMKTKLRMNEISMSHFTKNKFRDEFAQILQVFR